ncbi:condensation domain-containing protein [Nonomuraea sp. NPDC050663]|uniref:condensation domain-containing protein n=1 Tax=Nonomuraea sp. NPDC050663 TaxID=3364370 RepID=UPI003798E996
MSQASFVQHGMWVMRGAGAAYHMPMLVELPGEADPGVLAKACAAVAERHPLLSGALREQDGVAVMVPATRPPELRVARPGESVEDDIARPFDLGTGPLVRFTLFAPRTLLVTAHHVAFDGHSKDLLLRDLLAAYDGAVQDPPAAGFAELAEAERERVARALPEARAFWRPRWSEPVPVMVAGHLLSSRASGPGEVLAFELPRVELDGLTVFETTLAALHALLFLYGNSRVSTAVDLSTRRPESEEVIGPFVNELPVESRPDAGLPFHRFAGSLRAECRAIYRHREVPLARAVPGLRPHAALAPVSLSYRRRQPYHGTAGVDWLVHNGAVRGELQLQIVDDGQVLTASLRCSARAAAVAGELAAHLRAVLEQVAATPLVAIGELAEPAAEHVAQAAAPEPRAAAGPVDEELAGRLRAIWEEVLQISPIGVHDDLFDLGGHSLTVTQIIARMQGQLGIEVPLDLFFDNPTIAGVLDELRAR